MAMLADRQGTSRASTDAQTPCLSTPSQGQAHRKLRLQDHPRRWVGMAEPIRRWLRLALGSKPGLPRGHEPGCGVGQGGEQIVSPCARSFNNLQNSPVDTTISSVKISLTLCLSVQVKGRKQWGCRYEVRSASTTATVKSENFGCGDARWPRQRTGESLQ
ncbi:hypothetical protein J3F83DRAFT_526092 [Trichoderma novae-zelandiae]